MIILKIFFATFTVQHVWVAPHAALPEVESLRYFLNTQWPTFPLENQKEMWIGPGETQEIWCSQGETY